MSALPAAKRAVRIIALPLATPSAAKTNGHAEHLTYYHFVTPPPSEGKTRNWMHWVQHKAADLWAGLGKAPEGNWRVRISFVASLFLLVLGVFMSLEIHSEEPSCMGSASLTASTSRSWR